ncbi:MAG: lytic transglycosylase domain-containing protein [Desulfobulbaceae bacterium]|jgi:membrane-bound lytic murein transglycosylase D|nr:lytic transglycosylase domain-containing protein [Desulfobulbaceae bacterium]
MKKNSNHIKRKFIGGVLCCSLLAGCGVASYEQPQTQSKISSSQIISRSRVLLPVAGGQTIQVPAALMTDTYQLWQPVKVRGWKPSKPMPDIPSGPFASTLATDLPPSETDVIESYLYNLTHNNQALVTRVLERADEHLPVILESIRAHNLPLELACLPMVESAFQPRAVSPAGAAGLWQLMPETARRYGLTVNAETDERFDVRKATSAAIDYLADLYRLFNDWPLALAAYNCGEGAMKRALARTNTASLSELIVACRAGGGAASPLAEETLRYVPQFVAAVQIMTNSDKFGFTSSTPLRLDGRANKIQVQAQVQAQDREPPLTLIGRNRPVQRSVMVPRSKRIQ